ncbi:MAG: AsmA family protein [Rhodoferax sp.]|uniref:AsmA family protein n=1 Tax=Rhodoferax sp. TaxID=50421 RepID=UPI002605A805|nr:AsmA family protein [Rhodoferax sp.]MDD5336540.1 AsmA family protein [Rhodoferax sp.]
MKISTLLKAAAALLLAPLLLAVLLIAIFGWNWLRAPIERLTLEKTGRVLVIAGDLEVKYGWPLPRLQAGAVTFANPPWAKEAQMVSAEAVEITVDLPQLLRRKMVFPDVRLQRPVIFLELAGEGRKNWLLDPQQQDEAAHIRIDRLRLDQGTLGFDDALEKTSIRAELSTVNAELAGGNDAGLLFKAQGHYKGLPLTAHGTGGPVLALRDEVTPYPLTIDASIARTVVQAVGTVTSLSKLAALDMHLKVRGDSLEQLFPLLGIAVPATAAYATAGHLVHSGNSWRYEDFSGLIGKTDIAGTLQVTRGGQRPVLSAKLVSKRLDLADLGPLIGARPGSLQRAKQAAAAVAPTAAQTPAPAHLLPDLPFRFDRWNSVDAEVELHAKTIHRAQDLPLENLFVHLSLVDSVLTLKPLNFGVAGGQLDAVISLDGRKEVIQAQARGQVKKMLLGQLFPGASLGQASVGQLNGEFDLAGQGNSVARMLAGANGTLGLVVAGGEVSKLMMEKAGLHLWEILQLNLSGDKQIKLRCAVADFDVKNGKMQAQALIFDTQITTLIGTGSIDLREEQLDLTLNQKTKATSPLALRSPIYLRGSFAKPQIGVDKGRVAVRALGALALGVVNPLLAMLPLIDPGPGKDSDCGQLLREARKVTTK